MFRSVQAGVLAKKDRVLGWYHASGGDISSCQSCSAGWHSRCQGSHTHMLWLGTFFDQPFCQWALKGIKSMHHLTLTDFKRGYEIVKDTPEREIKLWWMGTQSWVLTSHHITHWAVTWTLTYLFEKIRNLAQRSVKILSVQIPHRRTLHLHLNDADVDKKEPKE